MRAVLEELQEAGGSLTKAEFYKLLAKHYSTPTSMVCGVKAMRKAGLVQDRIQLTATGSVRLNK